MNRDGLIEEIRDKLGYNTGLSVDVITRAIDNAQGFLEKQPFLPWFLETEITSIQTTSGEERVEVPEDFIRELEDGELWYYNTTASPAAWIPLRRVSLTELRGTADLVYNNVSSGAPRFYTLQGNYFRLFPIPDDDYTLKFIYYAKQALLTSGSSENVWSVNAPYSLIGKAGMLIQHNNRDTDGYKLFKELYDDDRANTLIASVAREHSVGKLQRGGDD